MLRRLAPAEQERLRAALVISSFAQCVRELVQNSIDSGALAIEVRVHCAEWFIEVTDDGAGIPASSMPLVAEWHTSSKVSSLDELGGGTMHGFRGEALAAIANVAILTITSRSDPANPPWRKIIRNGATLSVGPQPSATLSRGTVVTARDIFGALPVRRKAALSPLVELEAVRRVLEENFLAHSNVSFTLIDVSRTARILQTRPVCPNPFFPRTLTYSFRPALL